ncbi:MAG: site-specific integrase [Methylomicrobium sp.]|nr:site-specific integrase [Methylomicrobium sp.]
MARFKSRTGKDGKTKHTVEIRLKGFPPQAATFERLTDARKWAASTESAIRENRHFKTSASKKHTLADIIERYQSDILPVKFTHKEQLNRRPILAWWKSEIGYLLLSELDAAIFAECRDKLAKTQSHKGGFLGPDTIKKRFDCIKNVLKVACNEWLLIEKNPLADGKVELPSLPRGRTRFLDDDERERLLSACRDSSNEWLYLVVMIGLCTAMRKSEIMYLYWRLPKTPPKESAWGVVDLDSKSIKLHQTKNGDSRGLPIVGPIYDLLKEHRKIRRFDSDLLFPSLNNPQKPIDLTRPFENARAAAGLDNFVFHDLRHTCASYLCMAGASLPEISEITGHRDLKSLKRYLHLSQGHVDGVLADMVAKRMGGA